MVDDTIRHLIDLIRSGAAVSQAQLVSRTGLARATVASRVERLLKSGLVVGSELLRDTGGRPATRLSINPTRGYLLGADIGGSHTRVGLLDLTGDLIETIDLVLDVNTGPATVLDAVEDACSALLAGAGVAASDVLGMAVGVPGPVNGRTGQVAGAPTMRGWEGFPIRDHVAEHLGAPTAVDKDANLLAVGEVLASGRAEQDVIVLKVGMGIGAGIISHGRLLHGDEGAAGDLGHLPRRGGPVCRCGQEGCAEATAGGWAIVRELSRHGVEATTSQDVVRLASERDPLVLELLRQASYRLGEVLADAIGILNPALIIVAGNLAESGDVLLAGIRESVYENAHPLATRNLRIEAGRLSASAGLLGAGRIAADVAFTGERVSVILDAPV